MKKVKWKIKELLKWLRKIQNKIGKKLEQNWIEIE